MLIMKNTFFRFCVRKNHWIAGLLLFPAIAFASQTSTTGTLMGTPPTATVSPQIYYKGKAVVMDDVIACTDTPSSVSVGLEPDSLAVENLQDSEGDLFATPPKMEYVEAPAPNEVQLVWTDDTGSVITLQPDVPFMQQGLQGKNLTLKASFPAATKVKLFSETGLPTENDITMVSQTRTIKVSSLEIVGARIATANAEYTWPESGVDVNGTFPSIGFPDAQFIIETTASENAAVQGADGPSVATIAADNKQTGYEWSSSDDGVATVVSDSGLVTLKSKGTATITGKIGGSKMVSYTLTTNKWFIVPASTVKKAHYSTILAACAAIPGYQLPTVTDLTLSRFNSPNPLRSLAGEVLWSEWGDVSNLFGSIVSWTTTDGTGGPDTKLVVNTTTGYLASSNSTNSGGNNQGMCVNIP